MNRASMVWRGLCYWAREIRRSLLVPLLAMTLIICRIIWTWGCYWTREVRRLWVPLVAMVLIGYWRHELIEADPTSETARILYKVNIVSGGVVLAHMLRSQVFYYLNLGEMKANGDPLRFLGACILIGLFMFAIIYGFTLGL